MVKNLIVGLCVFSIAAVWLIYFVKNQNPQSIIVNPSPTPVSTITITPTPEISVVDQLKKAVADKYKISIDIVGINISQNTASHATGTVSVEGGGGWFLAFKNGLNWILVDDGNGTVSCEKVAPYGFPKSMVPECVDNQGKLIKY
ncbi:MAG TPA: hypothetical protein PK639_00905 [Candidatus Woesebacteria bacterium]|nr:hypothetical protein [Candidatus Woesebacteria bacterium]